MQRGLFTFLVATVLSVAASAYAQVPPEVANSTPEERAEVQTRVMKEKLQLTDAQLPRVQAINLKTAQKLDPVLKGSDGPLVKMRAIRAADEEREAALQGVLTPAQMQQLAAAREEIRQKVEQRLVEKRAGGAAE